MKLRVCIYCPDRHLRYDGTTPDRVGVGGGVTARVRVAEALARRQYAVTVACNCAAAVRYQGVEYRPLDAVSCIDADVLVMHSSGGGLDLSPLLAVDVRAGLRVLFLSGTELPRGSTSLAPDAVYAPSNFVRDAVADRFPRIFVTHHGVVHRATDSFAGPPPGPRRLIYASHPSKGLSAALAVWRLLRSSYPDLELHVCGGNRLWGGDDAAPESEAGLVYHGLLGQAQMPEQYQRASFSLHLQNRLEPFGLSLVESMAMGCIAIASPVGAYPELVRDGVDGFLIAGDCDSVPAQRAAANAIAETLADPARMSAMTRHAVAAPLSWDTVAETWEAHWAVLARRSDWIPATKACAFCRGICGVLPDGLHCTVCGSYFRTA